MIKNYNCGASLKDLGKKCFGINMIEDIGVIKNIKSMCNQMFLCYWNEILYRTGFVNVVELFKIQAVRNNYYSLQFFYGKKVLKEMVYIDIII